MSYLIHGELPEEQFKRFYSLLFNSIDVYRMDVYKWSGGGVKMVTMIQSEAWVGKGTKCYRKPTYFRTQDKSRRKL